MDQTAARITRNKQRGGKKKIKALRSAGFRPVPELKKERKGTEKE